MTSLEAALRRIGADLTRTHSSFAFVEQPIGPVIESAVADFGGNGGCLALQKLAAAIVGSLGPIGSDPAAAEIRNLRRTNVGG